MIDQKTIENLIEKSNEIRALSAIGENYRVTTFSKEALQEEQCFHLCDDILTMFSTINKLSTPLWETLEDIYFKSHFKGDSNK